MKTSFRFGGQGATRRFGMLLAALMLAPSVALAGITTTKHNLSSNGAAGNNKLGGGTSEICAFCHTPHGADTGAPAPLWNRKLPLTNVYESYSSLGTSTLDGSTAAVGSVSLACLSCHDGTQAMNTVINAPGSGLYNPTTGLNMAGTWTAGTGTLVDTATGKLTDQGGSNNGIAMIGLNLKNDHPVGIQYAGGGYLSSGNTAASNVDAIGTKVDADFETPKAKAVTTGGVTTVQFWVDYNPAAGKQKDDLPLYTRTDAGVQAGAAQPFVECASCHDPHTSTNATFLRIDNASSKLCLACHVK